MLVSGGKLTGQRLVRACTAEIRERGYAEVGAVSTAAIYRLALGGQRLANELRVKVSSEPREGEVTLPDGRTVMGIIVKFTPEPPAREMKRP